VSINVHIEIKNNRRHSNVSKRHECYHDHESMHAWIHDSSLLASNCETAIFVMFIVFEDHKERAASKKYEETRETRKRSFTISHTFLYNHAITIPTFVRNVMLYVTEECPVRFPVCIHTSLSFMSICFPRTSWSSKSSPSFTFLPLGDRRWIEIERRIPSSL